MTIVIMISVGLCLFTYKATEFNGLGFSFLLFASLVSGMRWSFAQLIMQKSKLGLHNPVDMVFHMQPWMILSVLPFTICFEGRQLYDGWLQQGADSTPADAQLLAAKVIGGACIAFFMELSEFLVLSFTSSLTLAVSGIFKEICQLVLAVELAGDRLSALNVVGLVMCLGGICSHVLHKYRTMVRSGARTVDVTGTTSAANGSLANVPRSRGHADGDDGKAAAGVGGVGGSGESTTAVPLLNWRSGGQQSVPLLNGSLDDSDDDDGEDGEASGGQRNSSDIIFDVLKRRDTRRQPLQ